MKQFARNNVLARWGLWDSGLQGAMGCYLAFYLVSGNEAKVGDKIMIPDIGEVEVLPNTVLDANAYTADDSGVVIMPERVVFTLENMDNYDF
jgi:AI-2 transport system substrate-binding protein